MSRKVSAIATITDIAERNRSWRGASRARLRVEEVEEGNEASAKPELADIHNFTPRPEVAASLVF
jgi:hypothetical protein